MGEMPGLFMQYLRFEDIILQLETLGLFDFILPFLLMFAIIFGVLSYTKIFGGKGGIHAIIAFVIGLLAVRWPVYTDFLNIISPKLGIGMVVILVLVLLIGMFIPKDSRAVMGWILMGVGVIIFLIILSQTYSDLNFFGYGDGYLTEELIGYMIIVGLLIGVIVAIVVGNTSGKESKGSKLLKSLWGDD